MYISKISYRKIFNLGNDEFETIEMTADLSAEDNVSDELEKLKVRVHNAAMDSLGETNEHDISRGDSTTVLGFSRAS